ncbi:hypothetical protein RQP46_002267 [Phenoliferia psychrophenolica]
MSYYERRREDEGRRTLFIRDLAWDTSAATLGRAFERIGPIVRCDRPGRKEIAFVEYWDARDAREAFDRMHHVRIDGSIISVELSETMDTSMLIATALQGTRPLTEPPVVFRTHLGTMTAGGVDDEGNLISKIETYRRPSENPETRRQEIQQHIASGYDREHIPTFSALWVIYRAARQVAVCWWLSPEDLNVSVVDTASLFRVEFPTLPTIFPDFGRDKTWFHFANKSCEAVVPGEIPYDAITSSVSFDIILQILPPFLATVVIDVVNKQAPPAHLHRFKGPPPTWHSFDNFWQDVQSRLGLNECQPQWETWLANMERKRSRADSEWRSISSGLENILPEVLRALRATISTGWQLRSHDKVTEKLSRFEIAVHAFNQTTRTKDARDEQTRSSEAFVAESDKKQKLRAAAAVKAKTAVVTAILPPDFAEWEDLGGLADQLGGITLSAR